MGRLLIEDGVIDVDRGEVVRGGEIQRLTPTERELLAYLVSRAGRDVPREELHQRVWGHSVRVVSRAVTISVHRLRRKIERIPDQPTHLVTGPQGYRWVPLASSVEAPNGTVVLVVAEPFPPGDHRWLAACLQVARTCGVYLVELAPDRVVLASAPGGAALEAARALSALAETRIGMAVGPAVCLVDPLSGRTLYGGITLERAGALARAARPGRVPDEPTDAGSRTAARVGATPVRLDRFVGRLEVLHQLLDAAARGPLVIVGAAGAGKSRLAEALVARLDRVAWFVPLDAVGSLRDAVAAVASAIGVPSTGDPVGAVGAALSVRGSVVLVLDGAERIAAEVGPVVARWHADAPDVLLVITSRDLPAVEGASIHELRGLTVADGVALIRERCPTIADGADLGPLVETLDGLPLALELVAPRLRILGVEELRARLDRLLDVLVRKTGDERHRSMRRALEESWDRLDEHERGTLVRATVFAGPFDLDAAEAVLGRDDPAAPWFVDTLQSLCDRHLVQVEEVDGRRRFRLLSTVRAFAAGHPSLLGEAERRHAERFAALRDQMPRIGPPPFGFEEMRDLALAVGSAVRHGWPELASRAAIAHAQAALFHSTPEVSLGLVEAAIGAGPAPYWLACLGNARSQLLRRSGRNQEAWETIRDAVAVGNTLGDPDLAGRLEVQLGVLSTALRDDPGAHAAFDRAEALLAPAGDDVLIGIVRLSRARLHERDGAHEAGLQAVRPLLDAADETVRAAATAMAGSLSAIAGDTDAAIRYLSTAISISEPRGEAVLVANFRLLLSENLAARGRDDEARIEAERSLATMREVGYSEQVLLAYTHLAGLLLAAGDVDGARRYLGEAAPWVARCEDPGGRGMVLALQCEVRAAAGDVAGAKDAAADAVGLLASCGDPTALARLAVHRGMAAVAAGDREASLADLAEGEAAVVRLGAPPWSAVVREIRRLRQAVRRVTSPVG